jgi:hypothetical protein
MLHNKSNVVFVLVIFIICVAFAGNPERISAQSESTLTGILKGGVLWLGGNTQYADAPHTGSLDLGIGQNDDFTIECFFYVPTLSNNSYDHLLDQPGSFEVDINFHDTINDYILFFINTSPSTTVDIYYGSNIAVGWHHLSVVFDNEHITNWDRRAIYLDGVMVVESENTEWTPGLLPSTLPFKAGFNSTSTYDGYIEEMRISNIVRYDGTTYTIPSEPFSKDANTSALWHFNEPPDSTTFYDSSDYGNHLTGHNGATTVVFFQNPIFLPLVKH